jgi:predicted MFS family arabinose efflux permease/predicted nucleic acid-binding Zn ribbon protein
MMTAATGAEPHISTGQAFGTAGYRNYVLLALTFVYTMNFIDRILIGVVAQPIIEEFKLADWQFGLLTGFGFALTYAIAGIAIARYAERANRVKIIAASIIVWSAMTALCGMAGSFLTLLIFRVGVGVGEAGCTPPANSIIADYFPPRSRARALATYAMGVTVGSLLANIFGGPIAEAFSWREAFLVLGIPGILVGVVIFFSIKEPPRGYSDPVGTPRPQATSIGETLKMLSGKRTYWLNVIAATLIAFVGYGITNFQGPFFQRVHGLSVGEVALQVSVPLSLAAATGTLFLGFMIERISNTYPSSIAWLTGCFLLAALPLYWIGFSSNNLDTARIFIGLAAFLHYGYLGAQYTICQGVVDARSRATAIAIMLLILNIFGYGLGPLTVGYLSDVFAGSHLTGTGIALALCKGTDPQVLQAIGEAKFAICHEATSEGLRSAIKAVAIVFAAGGFFYLWTSRTMDKDMVARMN